MPRVVPSQVVDFIDSIFRDAKREVKGSPIRLGSDHSIQLSAILDLAGQIPAELIVLTASQYAEYVTSLAAIRWYIQRWQRQGRPSPPSPTLIPGLRQHSPIGLIRQALAACPDECPAVGTAELTFILDPGLREGLRLDISTTNNALANGEWKAATVLAGSVIEALLLWALQQRPPPDIQAAVKKLSGNKLSRNPDNNLEKWVLHEYIEVAADLKIVSDDTATQTRLAKDFRNLIHPGLAVRSGQECNRATALSAVAALEHVVNDLTP